jgi:hypothetical protein
MFVCLVWTKWDFEHYFKHRSIQQNSILISYLAEFEDPNNLTDFAITEHQNKSNKRAVFWNLDSFLQTDMTRRR